MLALAFICSVASAQTYNISTLAGRSIPNNTPGTSASLELPTSVAVDKAGNVFVADGNLYTVFRLDPATGTVTVVAGNGTRNFTGDNGPAVSAQLGFGLVVGLDPSGVLYIADNNNQRVRKVSAGVIVTVAGNGLAGFTGDNGPATSAQLSLNVDLPGVAADSAGNLYIADTGNHRIRKVSGGVISTIAGNGTAGFAGDGGPAVSAELNFPTGLALDSSGNLYIADTNNHRIRKIANGVITTVAGNGTAGFGSGPDNGQAANADLNFPQGVALDSAGNLYIADTNNQRIRKVANGIITTVAGSGVNGFAGDGGPATSARLASPVSVGVDGAGNIYIADTQNRRVRKVANGVITTVVGNGLVGDGGPASAALVSFPEGVAVDGAGSVYVAEFEAHRIRKIAGGNIASIAGNGTNTFSGDGGSASAATLGFPNAVVVDSAGSLHFSDNGTNRVRKISGGVITTVAGTGTAGFAGDNGPATNAQLNLRGQPAGLAVDSAGNLYISDVSNQRVRKVSNGVITTVAGNGTPGFTGDNGAATDAQLNNPAGLALDAAGDLYIADASNQRVRKVSGGTITTFAGTGVSGFSGDGGPATRAQISNPSSIAFDSAGSLYLSDLGNNRIRKITNGAITTIAGNGTRRLAAETGPALAAPINEPFGVAVDAAGNVYVAEAGGNRIRQLTPAATASCTYSLSPASVQAPAAGGAFTIAIQTSAGCPWSVSGLPDWISVPGTSSGAGPVSLTLNVAPNSSDARTATLTIAGISLAVAESAGGQVNFTCSNTATPVITSIDSAGAYGGYSYFASGSWLEIKGTNLADSADPRLAAAVNPGQWTSRDFNGSNAPTTLDGVSVSINGKAAYVWFLSPTQINVQAPQDSAAGNVTITVANCRATSQPLTFARRGLAPGFLAPSNYASGGKQYMVATFATDGVYVLDTNLAASFGLQGRPAKPGDVIIAYGIGFGDVTPSISPGVIVDQANGLANPVAIAFGSTQAQLLYSGLAGNFVGLYEFFITVPPGLADGDYAIAATQNGVAIPQTMYLTVRN
jgi:uncharacterized protein (TIGR03437 family)